MRQVERRCWAQEDQRWGGGRRHGTAGARPALVAVAAAAPPAGHRVLPTGATDTCRKQGALIDMLISLFMYIITI